MSSSKGMLFFAKRRKADWLVFSMNETKAKETSKKSPVSKILSVLCTVCCVFLACILIINCTLIVKSYSNKDAVPDFAGYRPFIVMTGSMEPVIMSGDLIITKEINPSDVKVGDVISFVDPAGNGVTVVTHRVIEVKNENGTVSFRTRGDANNTDDQDAVPGESVLGIYMAKLSGMGSAVMFMQTTTGLIICVIVPLMLLVGYDILRRGKQDKKQKKEEEALRAELEALKAEKAAAEAKAAETEGSVSADEASEEK